MFQWIAYLHGWTHCILCALVHAGGAAPLCLSRQIYLQYAVPYEERGSRPRGATSANYSTNKHSVEFVTTTYTQAVTQPSYYVHENPDIVHGDAGLRGTVATLPRASRMRLKWHSDQTRISPSVDTVTMKSVPLLLSLPLRPPAPLSFSSPAVSKTTRSRTPPMWPRSWIDGGVRRKPADIATAFLTCILADVSRPFISFDRSNALSSNSTSTIPSAVGATSRRRPNCPR